jgi:hypothetical protein
MLRTTILNYEVLQEVVWRVEPSKFLLIQEIHAALSPLCDIALKLTQKTQSPSGYFTLPLLFLLLYRYGVDVSDGIFAKKLKISPGALDSLKFDVLQSDGTVVSRALKIICLPFSRSLGLQSSNPKRKRLFF